MLKGFFLYGMPLYITIVEVLLKYLLTFVPGRTEPVELALSGPSIAVAGISLLLPVLIPKPTSVVVQQATTQETVVIINKRDQTVIEAATVLLFILFVVWGVMLFMAHQTNPSILVLIIGLFVYAIGAGMTIWKEAI
jgi:hypothetical protein